MLLEPSGLTFQVSHAQAPRAGASDREAQVHESACLCDPFAAAERNPGRTRRALAVFVASAAVLAVLQVVAIAQAGADSGDGVHRADGPLALLVVCLVGTLAHVAYVLVTGRVLYRSCLAGMGHQAALSLVYGVLLFVLAAVSLGYGTDDYAEYRGFVGFVLVLQFVCFGVSALANTIVAMAALTFGNGRTFQYASSSVGSGARAGKPTAQPVNSTSVPV